MNILVIGGTGFISSYLLRTLVKNGHDVTLFNQGMSRPVLHVPERVKILKGDRNIKSDLESALKNSNYDAVYDMVAYKSDQSRLAVEVFYGKTGRFIHCSTVSVYMVSKDVCCPITEDQDHGELMPDFPLNSFGMEYGIQKRDCEKVLRAAHDEKQFPVTILRPTYVSGMGDPMIRDFFWIERIIDGRPLLVPGSGNFSFQQVYVEDVAHAFATVLERSQSVGEAYNVAAEEIFTLNEYLLQMGQLLDKQPELVHVDQQIFDELPFSSSPDGDVFPFNTRRPAIFSLDKIKRDLDYQATPFRKWMPDLIDWYLNVHSGCSYGYKDRISELSFINVWRKYQQSKLKEFKNA